MSELGKVLFSPVVPPIVYQFPFIVIAVGVVYERGLVVLVYVAFSELMFNPSGINSLLRGSQVEELVLELVLGFLWSIWIVVYLHILHHL